MKASLAIVAFALCAHASASPARQDEPHKHGVLEKRFLGIASAIGGVISSITGGGKARRAVFLLVAAAPLPPLNCYSRVRHDALTQRCRKEGEGEGEGEGGGSGATGSPHVRCIHLRLPRLARL